METMPRCTKTYTQILQITLLSLIVQPSFKEVKTLKIVLPGLLEDFYVYCMIEVVMK